MKKAEIELMKEHKLAGDAITPLEKELFSLEGKIDAFKNNPAYRALFDKKALDNAENRKMEVEITIEALHHYRHYLLGKEV
jgi:hypothetical protein